MTRRLLLAGLGLIMTACTSETRALKDVLPVQVQRVWTLESTRTLDAAHVPDLVRSLGMKQAIEAIYKGNGSVHVRVYEMNVQTSAFELIQKWRQTDSLAFYKGACFVTASGGPDRETLSGFVRALEADLKVQ